MNLYRITNTTYKEFEYDVYDSAVVAAETEEQARAIHPDGLADDSVEARSWRGVYSSWCEAKDVAVDIIGTATAGTKPGVILASYNAG